MRKLLRFVVTWLVAECHTGHTESEQKRHDGDVAEAQEGGQNRRELKLVREQVSY